MSKKKVIRKLTDSLRVRIKKDYAKLNRKDFDGAALTYLNRVKGAAKARKIKKGKIAKVDDLVIPRDSEIYRIIERAAKSKKMTVAAFIKKHRDAIEALMKDGDIVNQRETEYLIEDIKKIRKGGKVYVNDGNGYVRTPSLNDIYNIQAFTQAVAVTDIFLIIYRVHYKLNGDLTHYLPVPDEYEGIEENEEMMQMLDTYYPEITYLISPSKTGKNAGKAKPKRIDKRKETQKKNKRESNHR
jgi:hypothetical protein